MSVAAFVLEPQNVFEGEFYTPIAGEKEFEKYWLPAINELDLKYVKYFALGIDVTIKNVTDIKKELALVKEWFKDKYEIAVREFFIMRITNLETMLDKVFEMENATVFIG